MSKSSPPSILPGRILASSVDAHGAVSCNASTVAWSTLPSRPGLAEAGQTRIAWCIAHLIAKILCGVLILIPVKSAGISKRASKARVDSLCRNNCFNFRLYVVREESTVPFPYRTASGTDSSVSSYRPHRPRISLRSHSLPC